MMKTLLRKIGYLTLPLAALMVAPAAAQQGITWADNEKLETAWELQSTDSYLASRVGCYEGLTRISNDLTVEPALATAWVQTSPTTWEFTIRDGVKFQDGTDLTAETVAKALTNLLDAPVPARAVSRKVVEKVEATAPMTVTVTTVGPVVTLPGRLGAPAAVILSPAGYVGGKINPVGTCTGPFEIVSADAGQGIKTRAFAGYWGEPAKIGDSDMRFIPDAGTRGTMARSGEAQIVRLVPPYLVSQLESAGSLKVYEVPAPRVVELLLNNGRPPFDDERVRQAVKLAIDTAGISAAVYEGLAPPAGAAFRQGEPWSAPNAPPVTQDVAKAKALLAEAGIAEGALELELLVYTAKTELSDMAEIVQAMLGDIGIKVNVRLAEYAAIEPDMLAGNYDMALLSRGYLTDVPEPIGFLSADYGCEGSYNISQFCDPEIDAKLAAVSAEPDPAARYAGYAELAQYFYDRAVTVYIVNETLFDVTADNIKGYQPHPLNYYVVTTAIEVQ